MYILGIVTLKKKVALCPHNLKIGVEFMIEFTPNIVSVDMYGPRTAHNRVLVTRYITSIVHHFDQHAHLYEKSRSVTNVTFVIKQPNKANDNLFTATFSPNIPGKTVMTILDKFSTDEGLDWVSHDLIKNVINLTFTISHLR